MGLAYNKIGDTEKAIAFSDLSWQIFGNIEKTKKALENLSVVATEGILALGRVISHLGSEAFDFSKQLIADLCVQPTSYLEKFSRGTLLGTDSFGKKVGRATDKLINLGKKVVKAFQEGEFIERSQNKIVTAVEKFLKVSDTLIKKASILQKKYIEFFILSIEDPTKAKEKIAVLEHKTHELIALGGGCLTKMDKSEVAGVVGKVFGEGYCFANAFKLVNWAAKSAYTKTTRKIKKIIQSSKKIKTPSSVITTPEGITIAMNEGEQVVKGIENVREVVLDAEIAEKFAKEAIKNGFQMVGKGSALRNVNFRRGLKHAFNRHFFDKFSKNAKYALRHLDPYGNSDKWMQNIIRIAQTGEKVTLAKEIIKDGVVIGQRIEVWGKMMKTGQEVTKIGGALGSVSEVMKNTKEFKEAMEILLKYGKDYVDLGVRMFKHKGSDVWVLGTVLT